MKIIINNKEVDKASIEIDEVLSWDYPDFCDAYISEAFFTNGNDLSDKEIQELENDYPDLLNELALETYNIKN